MSWYLNKNRLVSGGRYRVTYDGMLHCLEIVNCREQDRGEILIVAKNSRGQVDCKVYLEIISCRDVFPPKLTLTCISLETSESALNLDKGNAQAENFYITGSMEFIIEHTVLR